MVAQQALTWTIAQAGLRLCDIGENGKMKLPRCKLWIIRSLSTVQQRALFFGRMVALGKRQGNSVHMIKIAAGEAASGLAAQLYMGFSMDAVHT